MESVEEKHRRLLLANDFYNLLNLDLVFVLSLWGFYINASVLERLRSMLIDLVIPDGFRVISTDRV